VAEYIGQTFGNYQIQERLGRGGMAEVYRAYHPNLNRSVAVKVLHPHLAEAADFIGRFRREAQAVARLHHPHIVQVYDFDAQNDVNYMVMELVEGQSLKALLDDLFLRGERLPLPVTLAIFQAVLDAIGYAHSQGMAHRDLKPANVMLANKKEEGSNVKEEEKPSSFLLPSSFRPVLMDFGIAKIIGSEKFTATGAAIGTPAYMSPEQGQGEAGDERSDLYALGIMLYECLTGQVPYEGDTSVSVLLKHITAPVPALRAVRPDLPEALERVVSSALAKDPRDRFQTAKEFWDALAAVADAGEHPTTAPAARTVSTPTPRSPIELPTRPRLALSKPLTWGVALLGVALLALAGFLLWPRLLGPAPTTQARALLAESKYQQAADAFTSILTSDTDNVDALLGRAEAYEALGQVEDALADVEQALALAPDNSAGYRERGRLLAQYFGEDLAVVLSDLDRAVELAGSDPAQAARAHYTRGWVYFNFADRDLAAALNDLQQATALDPQLFDAQLTLARALLANGQAPEAITPANRAIELTPTSALPHHLRAQINFALNDLHAAQDDLTAALERETDAQLLAVLYTERAHLAGLLGDEGGALADVQTALSHDARSLIALALASRLDPQQAPQQAALTAAQLVEVLAAAPDDPIWQAILQIP
jgi:serine/threonine protein kinase/lipoprotein NlpI